jgi:hypothetical protein
MQKDMKITTLRKLYLKTYNMNSIEFIEQMYYSEFDGLNHIELFEKAKQMHKAEILAAFTEGASDGFYGDGSSNKEKYYNETFKQPKQ